ncbi:MAG: cation transporter [Candidatus Zixiibacteriota bacterium]
MRKLTTLFALAALAVAFSSAPLFACEKSSASCAAYKNTATADKTTDKSKSTDTTTVAEHANCPLSSGTMAVAALNIKGMTCGGCEATLTDRLNKVPGIVMVASISSADGRAKVVYDKTLAKNADFAGAINDDRYSAQIVPAVAITTGDDKPAKLAQSGKATCSYSAKASKAGSKHAGCLSKGSSLTKGDTKSSDAKVVFASGDLNCCSQLTKAERDAFCAKFCKDETKEGKSTSTDS